MYRKREIRASDLRLPRILVRADPSEEKATFELDGQLHNLLKVYAAVNNVDMVEIVSSSLDAYLKDRNA